MWQTYHAFSLAQGVDTRLPAAARSSSFTFLRRVSRSSVFLSKESEGDERAQGAQSDVKRSRWRNTGEKQPSLAQAGDGWQQTLVFQAKPPALDQARGRHKRPPSRPRDVDFLTHAEWRRRYKARKRVCVFSTSLRETRGLGLCSKRSLVSQTPVCPASRWLENEIPRHKRRWDGQVRGVAEKGGGKQKFWIPQRTS